ncbi:hypothetical protein CRUP_036783 [Coryphaenoides rupestris]|nr:hypothetical protein CRUP_036783 [Coryphaenoides rupestris]
MYGGHITDDWDRRLCRTYLEEYIKPEMVEGEHYLAPGFPIPGNSDYQGYHQRTGEEEEEEGEEEEEEEGMRGTWMQMKEHGDQRTGSATH